MDLLRSAGAQLLPVLITAGSLIGFIAFAGAVIVWTRFQAVKVPPDQAVNAVPRSELVAVGASLLLLFGLFGVLAVLVSFLVDRWARATPGMCRWLLALLAIEGTTAILLVEGLSPAARVGALLLFLGPLAIVFSLTFVGFLVRREDELPKRKGEELPPRPPPRFFRWPNGSLWVSGEDASTVLLPLAAAIVFAAATLGAYRLEESAFVLVAGVLATSAALLLVVLAGLAIARRLAKRLKEEEGSERDRGKRKNLNRRRPYRLYFRRQGVVLVWLLLAAGVALPSILLKEWALALALASAVLLIAGLWRIAALPKDGFMWFGLTVFISVPLFGALALMTRNLAHPQVQPMALIRKTDGPYEAIQGLYVTEGNERIYFANVATEGCTNQLTPNSGRLLWVPKSEVVAMSLGPLQDVASAAKTALEMSYALTPGVETPAGDQVTDLTVAEKRTKRIAETPAPTLRDQRLESAGPAVRPNFGAGLSLSPEEVSPGEVVTLSMSVPNEHGGVEGFGRTRGGRTLRVGGVRADIVKEGVREATRAEYVETRGRLVLRLAKHEPYVETPQKSGEYVPWEAPSGKAPLAGYLKLIDRSVREVWVPEHIGPIPMTAAGVYLPLEPGAAPPTLEPGIKLLLRKTASNKADVKSKGEADSESDVAGKAAEAAGLVGLEPHPLTQAWFDNRIKFLVPENASSGPVSVECNQLAGQPLLRVSRPPAARIGVGVAVGSDRLVLDSRRSAGEDGSIAARRWVVDGLPQGRHKRFPLPLPARIAPYRVRLTVTDSKGETGTTEVSILRLPYSFLAAVGSRSGKHDLYTRHPRLVARIRHGLEHIARSEQPIEVDIDGFADGAANHRRDARLSLHWAEQARRELLVQEPAIAGASSAAGPPAGSFAGTSPIPVKVRAFGAGCPAAARAGGDRRIEIFVLEEGAKVTRPSGCRAGSTDRAKWLPPR